MTTVSIRDLHLRTGYYVRSASVYPLAVTDNGKIVAILQQPNSRITKSKNPLKKTLSDLVPVRKNKIDSTSMISDDRDRE